MEKMLICGVIYITVLILWTMYNYVSFKKKERNIKIINVLLKDALMYDYMIISCMYAMTFIIVWFMF